MKILLSLALSGLIALSASTAFARDKDKGAAGMTDEELIKTALSAAPSHISDNATIVQVDKAGKIRTLRQGTNEFTCLPDISAQETPDPFCGDKNAVDWLLSSVRGEPRPANTDAGIGYMAKGGFHWERDGQVVMPDEPGARRVKEPPHWMVFFPPDTDISSFPVRPGKFGAYVMYEGTPYAHLMIYQDPNRILAQK